MDGPTSALPWDEIFEIGADTVTLVDDQHYRVPFKFTGKIDRLTISVAPPQLTLADDYGEFAAACNAVAHAHMALVDFLIVRLALPSAIERLARSPFSVVV